MSGQRFDVPQPCLARYLEDRGNFIGQDPPLCARCTVGMEMVCSVYVNGRNELPSFALNGAPVLNSATLFLSPCFSRKIYACIHFPFSVTKRNIRERRKEGKKERKKEGKKAVEIAVVARRLPEAALILVIPYFSSYGRCIRDRGSAPSGLVA